MFIKFNTLFFLISAVIFSSCNRGNSQSGITPQAAPQTALSAEGLSRAAVGGDIQQSLDEFAGLERAGSWIQGMALTESGVREKAGDFAGAVAAAYKEMSWAYGRGMIQKDDIETGLLNLLEIKENDVVTACANAILSFVTEQWAEASDGLGLLFDEAEEPDSFDRWMILVCNLEKDREDRRTAAAYKAIRARYAQFPEYWYRGARAFNGFAGAEYAENCINIAPQGPFAGECRNILAVFTGLKTEDGVSIKTKTEVEAIIALSLKTGNPQLLDSLLPLISLPDNPYTVYAVGALRALAPVRQYRDYFNEQASASRGRLAERLAYICRS